MKKSFSQDEKMNQTIKNMLPAIAFQLCPENIDILSIDSRRDLPI
jgi:hypothetical protein